MKDNYKFNTEELLAITAAVETYLESKNAAVYGQVLKNEIKVPLCNSCLKKLDNYNPLTFFTKQEYTVMYMAVTYVDFISVSEGIEIPGNASAQDKLAQLADTL